MRKLKMSDTPIENVSDTAFMAAAYRAAETERLDALFRDPLAIRLAGDRGKRILAGVPPKAFMGGWTVIIRTCVIDEEIKSAIAEGVDTVLNLGAGLDTRPYRMSLPASLRWVEVDQQNVIEYKERTLGNEKPHCRLTRITCDLSDAEARKKVLGQATSGARKVLVLTEAVTPYLTEEAVASLAADLRSNPIIRYWIVDYFSPEAYEFRRRSGMNQAMKNAPFLFEPEDYFGFFAKQGWRPKEIRYLAKEAERLNRRPPFPVAVRFFMRIMGLFMSRGRREAMKEYAGFVLFEPAERA